MLGSLNVFMLVKFIYLC